MMELYQSNHGMARNREDNGFVNSAVTEKNITVLTNDTRFKGRADLPASLQTQRHLQVLKGQRLPDLDRSSWKNYKIFIKIQFLV